MTLSVKSILSCLVILATASDIHTKTIKEMGSAKELVVSQGMTTVLGEGMQPGQLPIAAYSLKNGYLDMSVYVESRRCDFLHQLTTATSIELKEIKQLTKNVVIILWNTVDAITVLTRALVIYTDVCANRLAFSQSWPLSSPDTVAIVAFISGYDIVTSKNVRVRFGNTSSRPTDPDSFPVNSMNFSISAISDRTYRNGYFIVDNTHKALKLVKENENGFSTKRLLSLDRAIILSNNEQSLYSACAFNPVIRTSITCYQFDELGNEGWFNSAQPEFDTVLDVKSLTGGGVVFAAFQRKGNKLSFVKLGKELEDVNIWTYSGKQNFEGARLKEYSEKDHTFVLAYMTAPVQAPQYSIVLQKFSLEN